MPPSSSSSSCAFGRSKPVVEDDRERMVTPPLLKPIPLRIPVTSHSRPPSPPDSPVPYLPPGPAAHSYYFEDGDLVLGVENVFLRLHGERLARCSTSFATLVADIKAVKERNSLRAAAAGITHGVYSHSHSHSYSYGLSHAHTLATTDERQFDLVDGCPFFRLDDKVKDWLVVLEAIYDRV